MTENNFIESGILDVDINKKMRSSYLDYSMSVIVARALPDVRDGLKPVHRRILYGMQGLNLASNGPYRKSARLVGDVMGKYHPHGDSSIYEATVRLAQDFNTRYPLVDGQGNFGNIDGDGAAAMRAAARMLSFPPVVMAHTVAVFLSFDGELDTQPLIEQLWQAGKRVYLPVLHPFSPGNLLFLHYHPQSALVTNRLKIQEPRLDVRDVLPLAKLDVLVTPLVAFDEDGQRLGMGGGFYDRTLQNWQQHKIQPVGYAHDCQLVEKLPVEEWDIPLPAVVTPSKIWEW